MIEEPYIVAEIPPDFAGHISSIVTSEVYVSTRSSRKKSTEVAFAIDHQTISIHDVLKPFMHPVSQAYCSQQVRQSRLITSYAVSPQTKFTCPPCSFFHPASAEGPARRATYCAVTSTQPRLLCFLESSGVGVGSLPETTTKQIDLRKGSAPVIHLELIRAAGENGKLDKDCILAIHRDGEVGCYSGYLEKEEWVSNPLPSSHSVYTAAITNIRQARKSLLKDREDILSSAHHGLDATLIIALLTGDGSTESPEFALRLFDLRISNADSVPNPGRTQNLLQELGMITLPTRTSLRGIKPDFSLHIASGALYLKTHASLLIYNVSGLRPKFVSEFVLPGKGASSFCRTDAHSIAVISTSSLSLLSLPYYAVLAEREIGRTSSGEKDNADEGLERPHDQMRLLSYNKSADAIIFLHGHRVLAVTVERSARQGSRSKKRKRDDLLVNSIGRGSLDRQDIDTWTAGAKKRIGDIGDHLPTVKDREWANAKAEMDDWLEKGDLESFGLSASKSLVSRTLGSLGLCQLPYLFSKIFTEPSQQSENDRKKIQVRFLPRRLFSSLLDKGLLTADLLETALKQNGSLSKADRISPKAFVEALADWDKDLYCLESLLQSPSKLGLPELICILSFVISQWSERIFPPGVSSKLLTDNAPILNRNDEKDSQLNSLQTRHRWMLYDIMDRLSRYPPERVTQSLKSQLSRSHFSSLLSVLQLEIAHLGYLSPYTSLASTILSHQSALQLRPIVHLLSSALDALGTGGWILGSSSKVEDAGDPAEAITYLRAEISAALEGVEECVYLSGLLEEVLLCGKDALQHDSKSDPQLHQLDGSADVTMTEATNPNPKPVIVPLTPGGGEWEDRVGMNMLPVGLKLDEKIPLTKVGAGGELISRSRRDIGRLKSRRVGKYSFERILI